METPDMNIIDEALGGKPGELEKQTNKMIDKKYGNQSKE